MGVGRFSIFRRARLFPWVRCSLHSSPSVSVVSEHVNCLIHFGYCFGPILTDLVSYQCGEVELSLGHYVGYFTDNCDSFPPVYTAPFLESLCRGGYRFPGVETSSFLEITNHNARVDGASMLEFPFTCPDLFSIDVHWMMFAKVLLDLTQCVLVSWMNSRVG